MSEELKPVRCGCGGEPYLKYDDGAYSVMCTKCGIETKGYCDHFDDFKSAKEYATRDWNTAMSAKDINVPTKSVENIYSVGDHDKNYVYGFCPECGSAVIKPDKYCSECGCRLEWNE